MRFDEHFITRALPDVSIISNCIPDQINFSVDSRTLIPGDIFIALSGEQQDGHNFVVEAFKKGASGCIIAKGKEAILEKIKSKLVNKLVLVVSDPVSSLIQLARAWRAQFDCPIVAVTGSVGKTSTKEMISQILSVAQIPHLASYGNQNTAIGVSLNILRLRKEHQAGIFELGISKRGEMAKLAHILRPTTGVITLVGHQHMDGLGSLQDIALEKRDIFKYFSEESIGIINGDQQILAQVSYQHPVIKFGSKTTNQIQARKVRISGSHISFVLKIYKEKYPIDLKKAHQGMVFNVLAATAASYLLHVPSDIIVKAIQMPLVVKGRFEERKMKNGKGIIINDCYNANPESMKAALLALQQFETNAPKVAVIGDMLGLGVNSPFWHRQIGRFLRKIPSLKQVILVGDHVEWTKKTAPVGLRIDLVSSWQEAAQKLETEIKKEQVILVKGSRAVGLDKLVEKFAPKTN